MPRIANLELDGMNFAAMTPEDQVANWNKNLRMWVGVAKRFGQLLRDTHHSGRHLMMMAWTDEQEAAHMVETLDSKLVGLDIESQVVLTPYKTAFLTRGQNVQAHQLEALYVQYKATCQQTWMTIDITDEQMMVVEGQIQAVHEAFLAMGVLEADLQKLSLIEAKRAETVGTLVTALAVLEIRSFATAEANRNLESEARHSQRAVRRGFGMQKYVNLYLPLVQQQQRRMGYRNTGGLQMPPDPEPIQLSLNDDDVERSEVSSGTATAARPALLQRCRAALKKFIDKDPPPGLFTK
jgi:hypothetical protein